MNITHWSEKDEFCLSVCQVELHLPLHKRYLNKDDYDAAINSFHPHHLLDLPDRVRHIPLGGVGVCPGLGGQLGRLVPPYGQECVHSAVEVHNGAQDAGAGVSNKLLTDQLQSSVNIFLRISQMLL